MASFFVSRVDTEIDKRLDAIGTPEATALKGKAGDRQRPPRVRRVTEVFSTPRWEILAGAGAHAQRPLWASTGVKNPDYDDPVRRPAGRAGRGQHDAGQDPRRHREVADHGGIAGDTVTGTETESDALLDNLERLGVAYDEVTEPLENEGVDKFDESWDELLATVTDELARFATADSSAQAPQ